MLSSLKVSLEKDTKGRRVLVDFYANWCAPCKMLSQILKNITTIDIIQVNVERHPIIARHFKVSSIPTLFIMNDGKVEKMHVGFINEEELNKFIQEKKES